MKILTNKEKKEILEQKEKAIIESFQKNFNKIKRIDESEFMDDGDRDDTFESNVPQEMLSEYLKGLAYNLSPYGKYIEADTLKVHQGEEGVTMEVSMVVPMDVCGDPKDFARTLNYSSHGREGNPGGVVSRIHVSPNGVDEVNKTCIFRVTYASFLDI